MDKKLILSRISSNNEKINNYRKLIHQLELENVGFEKKLEEFKKSVTNFNLNKAQEDAVNEIKNNSIIIACPGSGKTHTLVAKVVHLVVDHQVNPQQIVLVTFTKKAAQEMTSRLSKYLGKQQLFHSGTIHGLAYRMIQKYDKINYTIIDESESHKALRNCISKDLSDEAKKIINKFLPIIYDQLGSRYPINLKKILENFKISEHHKGIKKALEEYKKYKEKNKYLDFNQLMIKFLEFLESADSNELKDSIKYILFDEYQDVNPIQEIILRKLSNKKQVLTVVGDDAQSIYAFRGSEVQFILDFEKTYSKEKEVKVFKLENNYRSSPEIVDFCNQIISNNKNQIKKNMHAINKSDKIKPRIIGFNKLNEEIQYVVERIRKNLKIGIKLNQQVIITRKNRQLDQFELELIKNKINYVKSKGIGILDRIHVKDYLSFLVVVENPKSEIHWKRILNTVDGIGNKSVNIILDNNNKDHFESVHRYHSSKIYNLLEKLRKLFSEIYDEGVLLTQDKYLEKYKEYDYDDYLRSYSKRVINFLKPRIKKNMKSNEKASYEEKIEDLETLENYLVSSESISKFLEDIHLNIDLPVESSHDQSDDYLSLSTVHGSKGLEWDYVFFAGCSSEHVPSIRSNAFTNELKDLEEERRLFYVGCSRARKMLEITLSYSYCGENSNQYTSPFIKEIDPDTYDHLGLLFPKKLNSGNVTTIVHNYLLCETATPLYPYLKDLKYDYKLNYFSEYKSIFYRHPYEYILGMFIDNLIAKMIWIKYHNIIKDFDIIEYHRNNFKKDKYYYTYFDTNNDWRDSLDSVLWITLKSKRRLNLFKKLLPWVKSNKKWFELIEKTILDLVKSKLKKKNNFIGVHYNLSFGQVMGEADLIVNDSLIEIKTSKDISITTRYVLQTLLYRYMLVKKGFKIKEIIFFNPIQGDMYTLHTKSPWKNTFSIYNKVVPKKIKNE